MGLGFVTQINIHHGCVPNLCIWEVIAKASVILDP